MERKKKETDLKPRGDFCEFTIDLKTTVRCTVTTHRPEEQRGLLIRINFRS